MKITVIPAIELDAGLVACWDALQDSHPALASPFFDARFVQAVARARPRVRVAVIEDSQRVIGFLPFQSRWGIGQAAGASLSDHHGLVCAPGTLIDWQALLRAAGLACWHFDHLPACQTPPGATRAPSPGLDLSRGFDAWKQGRLAAGGRRVGELDRKARKLAREVGPLRLLVHSGDDAVFQTVLRLKSQQCRRTGVPDVFAPHWTRALAQDLRRLDEPRLGGRLSSLHAGDELVAAHFGMRSRQVWHWWFPVYAQAHARHSPGALLLYLLAQAAAVQGHSLLDLGKGNDAYKDSFADTSAPLAQGWVARGGLSTTWHQARDATSARLHPLRTSRLARSLRLRRSWLRAGATDRAAQPRA